ncbi:hypothetical protein DFH09DRAFT_1092230 [Mycena vulgaris]|nr:hypothetical protein DFH09DRAFT_1092230 [Mycena vulgaris]
MARASHFARSTSGRNKMKPTIIWSLVTPYDDTEWLAQATLLPKKKNDFLAHPGPDNAPDNSTMFIGAVYIKELNIYANSFEVLKHCVVQKSVYELPSSFFMATKSILKCGPGTSKTANCHTKSSTDKAVSEIYLAADGAAQHRSQEDLTRVNLEYPWNPHQVHLRFGALQNEPNGTPSHEYSPGIEENKPIQNALPLALVCVRKSRVGCLLRFNRNRQPCGKVAHATEASCPKIPSDRRQTRLSSAVFWSPANPTILGTDSAALGAAARLVMHAVQTVVAAIPETGVKSGRKIGFDLCAPG